MIARASGSPISTTTGSNVLTKFYTNVQQHGNNMLVRGFANGKRKQITVPYKPYLFVPSRAGTYKSIKGQPLEKMSFSDIKDAREFIKNHEDVSGFAIHGMTQFLYPFINDEYEGRVDYDTSLIRIGVIDIECDSAGGFPNLALANKEINAITLHSEGVFYTFGLQPYTTKEDNVVYVHCTSEKDLLTKFLQRWNQQDLDIVTGWNIEFFDVPYLVNRITNVLGKEEAKKLSPWRILQEKTVEINGKDNQAFVPLGISVLDFYGLYRKFTYTKRDSYRLGAIAKFELGDDKLEFEGTLAELYASDHTTYIDYNIKDVALILRLEHKLGFINQAMAIAYDAKVNYNDALTSVRLWDVIIHNDLMSRKIACPPAPRVGNNHRIIEGGYVKEPQPGRYRWLVSFDLTSLYPHIIMGWNMSPETLCEFYDWKANDVLEQGAEFQRIRAQCIKRNESLAGNGTTYSRKTLGFLPGLMHRVFEDRKKAKKEMLEKKMILELIREEQERRKAK